MDRADLVSMVDGFQKALVAHDPGLLPFSKGIRYTEEGQALDLGDGFWGTASAIGSYRTDYVDVETGNIAVFATMRENGAPVILVARLKVEDGAVSEIESFVVRASGDLGAMAKGPELLEARAKPDPIWSSVIPERERLSRAQLIAAADKYFWGLEKNDGKKDYSFFTADCTRVENGMLTIGNTDLRYGEGLGGKRSSGAEAFMARFASMSARQQFETGYFAFVDRIRDRRFPVVDVERGVVFSFAFFDHSGTVHRIPLSDGTVIEGGVKEPFTWEIGEAFKIEVGRIRAVEAVMRRCPYGMKPNWPA